MDNVNKTLYIPLYGKAYVSKKGIILKDTKAEEIWEKGAFPLNGKSRSKWLAYYMGMRSAVFDRWLMEQLTSTENSTVLHIGCGMDSRICRINSTNRSWYDVDFPDVIRERKKYYSENAGYHMLAADVRDTDWITNLPAAQNAIICMEGVSMYIQPDQLKRLLGRIVDHFSNVRILMDCYTTFAAKMSAFGNPINDVGGAAVYGLDDPTLLEEVSGLSFVKELEMTPQYLIDELKGAEKAVFKMVYSGKISKNTYRLYKFMGSKHN
ncbi:MAG: class I SAM-dependent methyltransferase [Lachnospiraceae bacterium]|nr:class I SAM-dependent methyltransferase [Lachnospiraceae bacterium]